MADIGISMGTTCHSEWPEGVFFGSVEEAIADTRLNGQTHYMRRAFDEIKIDGILCVDRRPAVYLKHYSVLVNRTEINWLHKQFWNQGTATILVVLDPSNVYIFSGMLPPSDDIKSNIEEHLALIEKLDHASAVLEQHQLVNRIASGQYYRQFPDKFRANNSVDRFLLEDLSTVSKLLCHQDNRKEKSRVHAFLGRIVFTCYLIDRNIIRLKDYTFIKKKNDGTLLDLLISHDDTDAIDVLYELFECLKRDFNGSMFDESLDAEKRLMRTDDIDILVSFLRGEQFNSKQQTLGFWAYNFSVIPVETISAIYEKFLEEEDANDKDAQGAFYTPKHLAEMVVAEAVKSFPTLLDKTFLDPACGSGIFLVSIFNRIAEEWRRRRPRAHQRTRARALIDVLEKQLCGVDVNSTACRIACFSLYVAFLDQFDPPTLQAFQRKTRHFLPKLLGYKQYSYTNTPTPSILEGNFFDPMLPISRDFDVVIGNPPWVGRNQPSERTAEEWLLSDLANPFLADAPRAHAERLAIFFPQRQIAHAFMWKVPLHLGRDGIGCLILPTKVLHNKTDSLQLHWFSRVRVERVIQLSDFRFFLFPDATCPSIVLHFGNWNENTDSISNRIEYITPKVRQQDPRSGLIPVSPEDQKWISLNELVEAAKNFRAATVWKSRLWGTNRDLRFLDYLSKIDLLSDICGDPGSGKRWIKGQGFKPWYQISYDENPERYGEPKPIPGQLTDPFIATISDTLQMFTLEVDCITLHDRLRAIMCKGKPASTPPGKLSASLEGFYRSPSRRIFEPPLVLVNKGFTKFSFLGFKVFFQHSLTGISADPDDANLLKFLTIYIKSKLASYFLFHTAGSWGTERDEVRLHELMRLPFPLPSSSHSSPDAEEIVEEVAARIDHLQTEIAFMYDDLEKTEFKLEGESIAEVRARRVQELQSELEPLVYQYFDLSDEEIILINDTAEVYEPSSTPATPHSSIVTLQPTTKSQRLNYASAICEALNEWSRIDQLNGHSPPFFFSAESSHHRKVGMTLITIKQAKKRIKCREILTNGQLGEAMSRIACASTSDHGPLEHLRGIIFADGRSIHILKPDFLGSWTISAALNDADRIFHSIIDAKRTNNELR